MDEICLNKLEGARYGNGFKPKDVVLYGFGRIGRLLARELMSEPVKGVQMRLRAIVTEVRFKGSAWKKEHLCSGKIQFMDILKDLLKLILNNKALIINGTTVSCISANRPEDPDYLEYGIQDALVIDNTGASDLKRIYQTFRSQWSG